MLDVVLKILAALGIVFLALLLLAILIILLVLFFPVTYRIRGKKSEEDMSLAVRVNWLFGFLRARYAYPEPGLLTARLLWFRLYQKRLPGGEDGEADKKKAGGQDDSKGSESVETGEKADAGNGVETGEKTDAGNGGDSGGQAPEKDAREESVEKPAEEETAEKTEETAAETCGEQEPERGDTGPEGLKKRLFEKIQKIKYTIGNIYDKIKEIWGNISYYAELMQRRETVELYAYVKLRIFKILKNIRPRHIRADILFGTGEPDTTGYAYGAYCMLSPFLGPRFLVRPDFERAVLQGEFDISGHVTVFVLVFNALKLMFDRKFRWFMRKLKKEEEKHGG